MALRARNKILTDALKAVEDAATEQLKTNFDLVWFARNRSEYHVSVRAQCMPTVVLYPCLTQRISRMCTTRIPLLMTGRYPNHATSKKLDKSEEHRTEIEKLRSADGDYHHGFHCGLLAASRLFKDHSDILHVNEIEVRFSIFTMALCVHIFIHAKHVFYICCYCRN